MNASGELFQAERTELTIRFADVDMMRVVHHAAYLHWFEYLRFQFLEKILGLSYKTLAQEGIACPIIECGIRYIQAITFTDKPVGFVKVELHKRASLTFHYRIFKDNQLLNVAATGTTSHCFVKPDLTLLLQTPAVIREGLKQAQIKHPDCCFSYSQE